MWRRVEVSHEFITRALLKSCDPNTSELPSPVAGTTAAGHGTAGHLSSHTGNTIAEFDSHV